MLLVAFIFGVFGLLIGSFLNVLVLRKGIEPLTGRSHCSSCSYTLEWFDLVPVFSWILLRGRCRKCGSGISAQYPLVEFTNGVLYALIGGAIGLHIFEASFIEYVVIVLRLCIVSLLLAITLYDFRHTIIPDEWAYTFAGLALFLAYVFPLSPTTYFLLPILAGPLAAFPLFLLWFISGGRWMGLGDPKLALGIGWLLGFPAGLIAIFASFIIGSLILVPLLLSEKIITHMRTYQTAQTGLTMKSEVPFGPFLVAAALLLWFFQLYGISYPLDVLGL